MAKIDIACIIDDNEIFVYGMKCMLEYGKYCKSIMVYHNGKEAFESLSLMVQNQSKLPDVILLDLNMPEWDGWMFLDEFIKIKPLKPITIYIVTSSVDQEDKLRAEQYDQVNDYIIKPVSKERIEEIFA